MMIKRPTFLFIMMAFSAEVVANSGQDLYNQHCASCHSPTLRGSAHGSALVGKGLSVSGRINRPSVYISALASKCLRVKPICSAVKRMRLLLASSLTLTGRRFPPTVHSATSRTLGQ